MIRFGPGGTAGLGYEEGFKKIHELGLSALEVEFTHGVHMKNDEAKMVGELAKKLGIALSIHAPYFINLASPEKPKVYASMHRIIQSCERGHHMGAHYVVFHAGFYQKREKDEVYAVIKDRVLEIQKKIKKWNIKIAPEVTGKPSAFGDVDELLRLMKDTKCHMTIDFSHLRARLQGNIDYGKVLDRVKSLKHIHAHFSGIEWTEKGEKRHVLTTEDVIKPFAEEVVKRNLDITIINESPDPINDAALMKKVFENVL